MGLLLGNGLLPHFGVGGFSVLALSPALWLDASDASTLYQDSARTIAAPVGQQVLGWADKSGNARHAIATNGPTNQASDSGRLAFDGVNDVLVTSFTLPDIFTLFIVHNYTSNSEWSTNTGSGTAPIQRNTNAWHNAGAPTVTLSPGLSSGKIASYEYNYSNDTYRYRINGAQIGFSTAAAVNPGGSFVIGARAANSEYFNGQIMQVVICEGLLSAANMNFLGTHLASRYGVSWTMVS